MQGFRLSVLVFAALLLTGCATYHAEPLPEGPDLRSQLPDMGKTRLSMTQAAGFAVLGNPGLKAERAKWDIASAQAFQAGLLPNPQVSASIDQPTTQGQGLVTFDLQSLLTHSATSASAKASAEQARLDLLWQEWQTAAKARTLFTQAATEETRISAISSALEEDHVSDSAVSAALSRGDLAPDQADALTSPRKDLEGQLLSAENNHSSAMSDLKALLGLTPQADLHLAAPVLPALPDKAQMEKALSTLPSRRPDLLALQQGYKAQEEAVFKAVLSQFPNIQIGFTRASDTSNVHTTSFGVSMDLPIFDQGQGRIAIERATRKQLRQEYQARIDRTRADAWRLWRESRRISARLQTLTGQLPTLQKHAAAATKAASAGDLDPSLAAQLQQAWLSRQTEFFDLQDALWSDLLSLDTTLCLPAGTPPEKDRSS
jgi:outer membrane protein TolC